MGTRPDWALYPRLVSCHCTQTIILIQRKCCSSSNWLWQSSHAAPLSRTMLGTVLWGGGGGAALHRLIPHHCCWWLCCATNKYSIDGLGKYKLTRDWWSDSCATQSPGSMLWSVPRAATLWNIIGGCNKDICMCVSVRWYSPLPPGVMDLIIYNEYHRKRQLLLRHIYIQIHPVTSQHHSLMYKYQLKHWGIMPSNILHGQYV